MSDDTEEVGYEVVVPFVVVQSEGGPFDDEAYVCGFEAAKIDEALTRGRPFITTVVHTANMPQFDLMAMRWGYTLRSERHDDDWTSVWFTKAGA